jgi:uncharacterized protein YjeT (DUF2065 family)
MDRRDDIRAKLVFPILVIVITGLLSFNFNDVSRKAITAMEKAEAANVRLATHDEALQNIKEQLVSVNIKLDRLLEHEK